MPPVEKIKLLFFRYDCWYSTHSMRM